MFSTFVLSILFSFLRSPFNSLFQATFTAQRGGRACEFVSHANSVRSGRLFQLLSNLHKLSRLPQACFKLRTVQINLRRFKIRLQTRYQYVVFQICLKLKTIQHSKTFLRFTEHVKILLKCISEQLKHQKTGALFQTCLRLFRLL